MGTTAATAVITLTLKIELASSDLISEIPGVDMRSELAFRHLGDVSGEDAHYRVTLFVTLPIRDNLSHCVVCS